MKWLLLIVFLGVNDDSHSVSIPFDSKPECIAAAKEFVRRYPEFDWYDRPSNRMTLPVLRSYVKCHPESGTYRPG